MATYVCKDCFEVTRSFEKVYACPECGAAVKKSKIDIKSIYKKMTDEERFVPRLTGS